MNVGELRRALEGEPSTREVCFRGENGWYHITKSTETKRMITSEDIGYHSGDYVNAEDEDPKKRIKLMFVIE